MVHFLTIFWPEIQIRSLEKPYRLNRDNLQLYKTYIYIYLYVYVYQLASYQLQMDEIQQYKTKCTEYNEKKKWNNLYTIVTGEFLNRTSLTQALRQTINGPS